MIPKIALLVLIFAVVAGAVAMLLKGAATVSQRHSDHDGGRAENMQRLSFFLLLALIAYVAATGAS
ncbi:hypothetical protein [Boseongicola aestuarii]|jgi:hypothetical protein|uniref:Uncharacterized protein n=1 Tax=Boseongicola aestuarii TaxID=1470561 RepID=A0A238IZL1_9RHOB|nr:hypothetical protein [Boseongicola aestuarii]SMX23483.1 hypothetical protein BOA8489_01590 [Boseongicola aestuarii]